MRADSSGLAVLACRARVLVEAPSKFPGKFMLRTKNGAVLGPGPAGVVSVFSPRGIIGKTEWFGGLPRVARCTAIECHSATPPTTPPRRRVQTGDQRTSAPIVTSPSPTDRLSAASPGPTTDLDINVLAGGCYSDPTPKLKTLDTRRKGLRGRARVRACVYGRAGARVCGRSRSCTCVRLLV